MAEELRATIGDAASREGDVLLEGEIGTGKELAARILHYSSPRSGSYLELRCGALTESALEIELFGCVKGARPDLVVDRPGLLLLAQEGTLFLDEVGELPLSIQQRLLDVLQSGSLLRLGSNRLERVGCRILASSRTSIAALVSAGTFLSELHRRLAGISVRFPALRDHVEDVPELARLFLHRHGLRHGVEALSEEPSGSASSNRGCATSRSPRRRSSRRAVEPPRESWRSATSRARCATWPPSFRAGS